VGSLQQVQRQRVSRREDRMRDALSVNQQGVPKGIIDEEKKQIITGGAK